MSYPVDPVLVAEVWELGGQRVGGVHLSSSCEPPCPLHHPSEHSMRTMPLLWRNDRGIFERTCPHGVGHPDPDQAAFWVANRGEKWAASQMVHGCDGCCR